MTTPNDESKIDLEKFLMVPEVRQMLPKILKSKFGDFFFEKLIDKMDNEVITLSDDIMKYGLNKDRVKPEQIPDYLYEEGGEILRLIRRVFSDYALILNLMRSMNHNILESQTKVSQDEIDKQIDERLENNATFKWVKKDLEDRARDTEKIDNE